MATATELSTQLDRLASFEPGPYPVISVYLNLQPDDRGRDRYDSFVRNELSSRVTTYPATGRERESLDRDAGKIRDFLEQVDRSANGVAIFASSGAGLFETVVITAPIDAHRAFISDGPHLYPLARLIDEYPRYAVLVANTRTARLLVVAANVVERAEAVEGVRTRRHKMGGWSQSRYQRHIDNFRAQHAKEAAEVLIRTVRDEQIPSIIISGDEVIVPLLKAELPKDVAAKVVDVLRLDTHAPEHEVLRSALEVMRHQDVQSDRERVDALLDGYRAGGLATAGVERVTLALEMGQVDELLIPGQPDILDTGAQNAGAASASERTAEERLADTLIAKACQTSAAIRVIEDPDLLAPLGGVGAFLRFTL